jgi:oxygen-independent coproporphyrinogen-3 oxidase
MKENKPVEVEGLPANYFEGKDGLSYRFTILKDIAAAGRSPSIPYDDSQQESIFRLYDRYRDFTLYVHLPWCVEHCSYCHYYRGPMLKKGELETMLQAERKHALMMDQHIDLPSRDMRSIYFGGGTPTVLPPDLLEETLGYYVERYRGSQECEVCLEGSIITLKTAKKIEILERYVNRLSVGVQSFDDDILKLIERKHTGAQAKEILKELVPRFAFLNVDLIYGLYDQSLAAWLDTVKTAIGLGISSLTIYRLDIRDIPAISQTFHKEPHRFPDEFLCWRMYNEAEKMLLAAGYRENLVGWYLLPSVKDTTVYRERWEKQSPCISFGPRLHNYAADHFYETLEKHEDYIAAVEAGKLPIRSIYPLSPQKQLVWYVLAQWKSNSPVYKSMIIQRFGQNLLNWFMNLTRHYLTWGVLNQARDEIQINEEYHYILEWILLELIDSLE